MACKIQMIFKAQVQYKWIVRAKFWILSAKFGKYFQQCPVQQNLPRKAEFAWQVSRYLYWGSWNFKIRNFWSVPSIYTEVLDYTVGNIFPLDPNLAQGIQNLALTIHLYWVWTLEIILDLVSQFLDWQWSKLLDKGSNNRIPNSKYMTIVALIQ